MMAVCPQTFFCVVLFFPGRLAFEAFSNPLRLILLLPMSQSEPILKPLF